MAVSTVVLVMTNGIGAHLSNDEKRAHLIDLKRAFALPSSATEGETGLIGFAAHAEGDALDALAYGIRAPSSEHPNTFTPFRRPTLECSDVRLGVARNAQTHPRIAPPCNHAAAQARR